MRHYFKMDYLLRLPLGEVVLTNEEVTILAYQNSSPKLVAVKNMPHYISNLKSTWDIQIISL